MRNISREKPIVVTLLLALLLVLIGTAPVTAVSAPSTQKTFSSAQDAVQSLVAALRKNDDRELSAILGPHSREIVSSGDPVADKAGRERFVALYDEKNVIDGGDTDRAVLSIGKDGYPFPVPLVKKGGTWSFDAKAGKEELLNRRIGRNELEVMDTLRAYVDAQRDYAAMDPYRNGGEFAQRIHSTPGKKDGLYWKVKEGEEESPFGPLVAKATVEGYKVKSASHKNSETPSPYHGYLFRILKAQGKDAPGGAFNYVVNGSMVLGFAMIAYPAQYGASGVMTFIVNQDGIVYQKNLGKETGKIAPAIKAYNPDKSWQKVEPASPVAGDEAGSSR